MAISKKAFSNYIRNFDFRELFNELGWNNDRTEVPISIDNTTYQMQAVAEKRGFKIIVCNPQSNGIIPDYITRKKIETKVTKLFQEHLIIFTDSNNTEQIWQLVLRQTGKPVKITETRWKSSQEPEMLFHRASGIFFKLDEEDKITIVDVTKRIADNFHQNNERVTKKFFTEFKKEHSSFLKFIKGISDRTDQDWYASLMLNRLMFCYFIQKKGFLDNNKNYLRDKLTACKEKKGKDRFYSFYRNFLLVLFHKGLNVPVHNKDVSVEIGRIPYLNGGLFDEHELEQTYSKIEIDDLAFESLFNFFDQYEWYLDTRIESSGRDINPDVIGYIFEKYINDRAQMGAYYTKEDITDYISKYCIIPFLFEETKRKYPKAFTANSEVQLLIKSSGDKYIYEAVKKGIELSLPDEIEIGIDTQSPHLLERRKDWNTAAPEQYALPTEIWREVVDRRKRYFEVKAKIEEGEIQEINDFITYNLNIRQFIQDVLENTTDPYFIRHFYQSLVKLSVIDPTCGSGAFLFAAMFVLEPLYETCLQRMENFVNEAPEGKFKFFEEVLVGVNSPNHPNRQYFIYKSIILHNLYGVDIMKEAVEIAKLRLFLKLVATVEPDYRKPNLGLEPLPDIDFNIRAGNTLIGFATESELKKGLEWTFDGQIAKPLIEEKSELVAKTFKYFKEIQLTYGSDYDEFKQAKAELTQRLKELNSELNILLHKQYSAIDYDEWLQTHQPFHWFAEFYEIIQERGGFDVVIGNPPYVEYSTVKKFYVLKDFFCFKSGNLYSYVIERAITIQKELSYNGMIIPLSAYCTDRMDSFQQIQLANCSDIFISFYAERPSKLFEGAERSLAIAIFKKQNKSANETKILTTYYYKWNSIFRKYLFENISFANATATTKTGIIPKVSSVQEVSILNKLKKINSNIGQYTLKKSDQNVLYYRNSGGRYWKIITDFQPSFFLNEKLGISSRESYLYFKSPEILSAAIAVLNTSLYYWYYVMHSDARTNNPSDLKEFPINLGEISSSIMNELLSLLKMLMKDLQKNSVMQSAKYRTGIVNFQQFFPQNSKHLIDEIDKVLAKHYGFTEEELDFIINYDIKYRMGKESGESEEN
jgi:hypothetical protein